MRLLHELFSNRNLLMLSTKTALHVTYDISNVYAGRAGYLPVLGIRGIGVLREI